MLFKLGLHRLSAPPDIEISEDLFKEIKSAKNGLITTSLIEETFSAVLENYLEFETELLEVTARHMILEPRFELSTFQSDRERFNRRLMNLLSTSKSYLDHSKHRLSSLFGKGTILHNVVKARSTQYDSILGYRAMELLRNYVQHQGFPIHGMSYASNWESTDSELKAKRRMIISVRLNVNELKADPEHRKPSKAKILEELPHNAGMCDLRPLIREYIAGLSSAHKILRDEMNPHVVAWDAALERIESLAKTKWPQESLASLSVYENADNDNEDGRIAIPPTIRERCKELSARTIPHENLPKFFVSNEIA